MEKETLADSWKYQGWDILLVRLIELDIFYCKASKGDMKIRTRQQGDISGAVLEIQKEVNHIENVSVLKGSEIGFKNVKSIQG